MDAAVLSGSRSSGFSQNQFSATKISFLNAPVLSGSRREKSCGFSQNEFSATKINFWIFLSSGWRKALAPSGRKAHFPNPHPSGSKKAPPGLSLQAGGDSWVSLQKGDTPCPQPIDVALTAPK